MPFTLKTSAPASKRRLSPWLVLSCLLHAALLAWIATWAVERVAERGRAAAGTALVVRSEDVRKLKAYLEEHNVAPLRGQVADLQALKQEIAAQRDARIGELREFERRMTNDLPRSLDEALARVAASQRETLAREGQSAARLDELERTLGAIREAAARDSAADVSASAAAVPAQASGAREPQNAAGGEQQRTLALMKDAEMLMDWVGDTNVAARWTAAQGRQRQAGEALSAARSALGNFEGRARGNADHVRGSQAEVAALVRKLAEARVAQQDRQARAAGELERARGQSAEVERKARDAERAAAEAGQAARQAAADARKRKGAPEAAALARKAEDGARAAAAAAKTARAEAQQAAGAAKAAEAAHRTASQPVALARDEQRAVDEYRKAVRELSSDAGSRAKLDAAIAAQQAAASEVASATAALLAAASAAKPPAFDPVQAAAEAPVYDLDAAGSYRAAVGLEREVGELYREARAAELAMLQGLTMDRAMANTQVPVSDHAAVDLAALAADVRTAPALKAFENAFAAANREVSAIRSAAAAMRDTLRRADPSAGRPAAPDLAGMLVRSAHLHRIEGLASELSGKVQDVSQAMRQAAGEGAGAAEAAASAGRPGGGGADFGPASKATDFRGLPGREVAAQGRAGEWFYVPSWYTIGPFANEGRKNIDMVFPPESIVDLNAAYTGKGGRPVRWEFVSSPTCQVEPNRHEEYAIYYAYTEVKMAAACDLWLAVGSDDRSDLWVNDMPVWRSGNQLKNWNLSEGYRKVHFRAGRNKLLVRVENGWGSCCFSVLVCGQPG